MPMIEAKVTMQLSQEKRDILKAEFGKAITIMRKPESYLIINLSLLFHNRKRIFCSVQLS